MRLAILLLASTITVFGQFRAIQVHFQDTGCASCVESLQGRLSRVRGVEQVEVNAEDGIVKLQLSPDNRVRLTPLLSRITQDGTKILETKVIVLGTIKAGAEGDVLTLASTGQTFDLQVSEGALEEKPDAAATYIVRGKVTGIEPGGRPTLAAESISPEG